MKRKIIFKCKVGSNLYGLTTPESDVDYLSVFIPTSKDLLGLNKVDMINNSSKKSSEKRRNTKDDTDDIEYSLPKFMELLLKNNPNIIEVLFATEDNIEICTPEFAYLMQNYDKIVSTKTFHTFTGFAYTQKKKLESKRDRYGSLLESISFMEEMFGGNISNKMHLTEQSSAMLNSDLKYYKRDKGACNSFHKGMPVKDIYDQLCAERDKYGWRVKTDSFMKLGYDTKYAYNLIRILAEGCELLETVKIIYPMSGTVKEQIMSVKNGEHTLEEVFEMYEVLKSKCDAIKKASTIRTKPDFNWANNYLINILKSSIVYEEEIK